MSLEISLTSRTQLPPDSIKSAPPPPVDGGSGGAAGPAPASTTPAAIYTPGVAPSNAGAYFRPASSASAETTINEAPAAT